MAKVNNVMDDEAIVEALSTLKLRRMADANIYQKNNPTFSNMTFRERFSAILTEELESKSTRRTERLLKASRIANVNFLEQDVYWDENLGMKEAELRMLCECDWMVDKTPPMLLLTGSAGTGKTFFAEYLGLKAIRKGVTVLVCKWPELILQIIQAKEARELQRLIKTFRTKKLLIIDNFGLQRITDSVVLNTFQALVDSRWGRVNGYTRKDGTHVRGHYRSRPDGTDLNNWTTRGNVNPHTGKPGTRAPRKYSK